MPEPSPPRSRALRAFRSGLDPDHGGSDAFGNADHGVRIGIQQGYVVILGLFSRSR